MWGFSPRQNADTTYHKGRTLNDRYTREELWLRSDVSRLIKLFDVATPGEVKYKTLETKFR